MKMKNIQHSIFLLIAFLSFFNATAQQQNVVRGRIYDASDKTTIVGANIIEYDSDDRVVNGAVSNVNGDFVLQMRNPANVVRISVIGYEITQIKPDFKNPMSIDVRPSTVQFEEITVTARARDYSRLTNIEERDDASSTVRIDMRELQDVGFVSAADALQGRVTGLDIMAASGDPGSGSQIVIRGLSSMGNSRPLIVIDGIPQSRVAQDFALASADMEDISNLINIALQDIRSISVLKDGASTAVYGSSGADGVLLIETHQGRMGKVQFDYQYRGSANIQPPAIPMLNGNEYIMLQLEQWHNNRGIFTIDREIAFDRDFADFYNYSANTDWLGAVTQNSLTHDHYFNLSGGGERTRYFTSFGYMDEGGTTINTSARRFSTRINLDYFLSRRFVFSVKFNYYNHKNERNLTMDDGSGWRQRNIREMAYIKAPNMSIWEYDSEGNPTGEYFNPIRSYQGSGEIFFNPVALSNLGRNDRDENSLENTFQVRYSFNDWLTFRETITLKYDGNKEKRFLPYNALGTDWLAWSVNRAEEGNGNSTSIRTETQFLFNSPWNVDIHDLSGALTWITDKSGYEWMNIQANKIPSTSIQDPAFGGQINWIGSGSGETRELGALANVNYKYKDRYLVQTILRADAHSSFGSANRWGLFKGVSLGWRFSSEEFLTNIPWLGESMFRASWGVSGRQPRDAYARFSRYESLGSGNYLNYAAIGPTQVQLDNLRWESITSYDLGIDLNLFNDKVFITSEVYEKITTDLLFERYELPYSSGYDRLLFLNGGELQNRGWEFMAEYRVLNTTNWRWSLNFNTTQNKNRFNKLPDNFNTEQSTSIGNGQYPRRIIEGEPIGSFFGFIYKGVYPTDADAYALDADGNIIYDSRGYPVPMTYLGTYTFRGGDAIYEDINNDGQIDLNDVIYIGNSNPRFTGGFGTAIRYKNFDFTMNFHYRVGFDIINEVALQTQGMLNKNNQSKAVLSRWRVQGQDEEGMLPRAYLDHPANNLGSNRYVERGDFFRLNSLQLRYRIHDRHARRINARTANISISSRNLYTFTRYSGQDPEVGQNASDPFWMGVDRANTPPPKVTTLTLNIGF
jgi:TonB-linked SusC/RagA family outer membrane protein